MTTGEIVAIIGVSITAVGLGGRWLYNQGAKDRDSETVREWKLEVIRQLNSLSTSQFETVSQLKLLAQTVAAVVERVEGLEDRERGRGTHR